MTSDIKQEFNKKKDLVSRRRGYYEKVVEEKVKAIEELSKLKKDLELYKQCVSLFQLVSSISHTKTKEFFEKHVTNGLCFVFPEHKAVLEFSKRGNLEEVDFLLKRKVGDKWITIDPYRAYSGGVVNIYAFTLRLVLLLLRKDFLKTLILDETFAHVSPGFRSKLVEFLKQVGVQIIFVTNENEYVYGGDKIIKVDFENGRSVVGE